MRPASDPCPSPLNEITMPAACCARVTLVRWTYKSMISIPSAPRHHRHRVDSRFQTQRRRLAQRRRTACRPCSGVIVRRVIAKDVTAHHRHLGRLSPSQHCSSLNRSALCCSLQSCADRSERSPPNTRSRTQASGACSRRVGDKLGSVLRALDAVA